MNAAILDATLTLAPELDVATWLNSDTPIALGSLRGRVVVIEAFQMLCPGCVAHGIPQAQRIAALYSTAEVAVIGLHTVFEHHEVQGTREALAAFIHENRVSFPVGIDRSSSRIPATMAAYGMQGTPTLILIDQLGRVRSHHFGSVPDLQIGSEIGMLRAPAS